QQFQKDEIHSGYTEDTAPIRYPVMAWNYSTSGGGWSGIDTTPIVADGKVFALNYQGYLYAFNATTGDSPWNVLCNADVGQFELAVPAYHSRIVYAATSGGAANVGHGRVTAVHADNGSIREMVDLSGGADGFQLNTPVTYADNRIYVGSWKGGTTTTNDSGTYFCLSASNVSDVIWSRTADYNTGYYWAGPAIIGPYLVYGCDRSNVTCLDKETGALIDYINVSEAYGLNAKEIRSSIVWNDEYDRIYFTSKGGYAFALGFDQTTGQFIPTDKWSAYIGYSTSTPAVYDGRLYVGKGCFGSTGKVYCLSESDGSEVWSTPNLGGVQSSPALSVV
ncbi:MAG: PQQ-binding-like beta-propeller repeat protein, partial [Methanosarcinales archaeon]|nr:PQQ-binding-like beta-propeller repeat protein [Methanosarcinales archaeon]